MPGGSGKLTNDITVGAVPSTVDPAQHQMLDRIEVNRAAGQGGANGDVERCQHQDPLLDHSESPAVVAFAAPRLPPLPPSKRIRPLCTGWPGH
jgi:hypothetical protein